MIFRREKQGEAAAIRNIVIAAFGQAPEADLVDSLRDTGDVELSLARTIHERSGSWSRLPPVWMDPS